MLSASLPAAVGVNRLYGRGRQGLYKSRAAVMWTMSALVRLRLAGFRTQPEGVYWIEIDLDVRTIALDIDAPLKLAIDVVSLALGIDDRWVGRLGVRKVRVRQRADQRL